MKRKKVSKLSLHRETLASLSESHLERAAGGTIDKSCLFSCYAGCSDVGCTDTCPPTVIRTCRC